MRTLLLHWSFVRVEYTSQVSQQWPEWPAGRPTCPDEKQKFLLSVPSTHTPRSSTNGDICTGIYVLTLDCGIQKIIIKKALRLKAFEEDVLFGQESGNK